MHPFEILAAVVNLSLAVVFSMTVIVRRREPAVTLAWILSFFFLPVLGIALYASFGYRKYRRRRRRKPDPGRRAATLFGPPAPPEMDGDLDPRLRTVERLATQLTDFPPVGGNRVTFYEETADHDRALLESLQAARRHIHMEYYIFQMDATGRRFVDILAEKARAGVECRLLLDAVGSFSLTKRSVRPLEAAGVKVAFFGRMRVKSPWGFHLRNHRKISVIDGKVGFLGSQNIGAPSVRWRTRWLRWRDTAARLEGPVVHQIQTIFTEDWAYTTKEELGIDYFPALPRAGDTIAQTLPTGPDARENTLHLIFLQALHSARERITLTTPYFVPSTAMALALEGAARRGVRVDLLLPRHSDHPVVMWAGRSWYKELVEAGVRIHEYGESFIHAKVVTVDGRLALVGSANMDIRSFTLNYEASVLIYDPAAAARLEASFDGNIARAREIRAENFRRQSFTRAMIEGTCRVLSPLL